MATAHFERGANRQTARTYYIKEIGHYVYAGDTALHIADSAYRQGIVQKLIATGANVRAKNRRGAEPLRYAVNGVPGSPARNLSAQAATVASLIDARADPNAIDGKNKSGSTPMLLATQNTGRGGQAWVVGCARIRYT